jgi:hypothetical protein
MKEKPKAGQQVFVVHQVPRQRTGSSGQSYHAEVLRVGTKYCYLRIHGRDEPFDWRTGRSADKDYRVRANGLGFDVYDSKAEWAKQQFDAARLSRLKERIVCRNGWALVDMPPECVERIHAVLDEFGIETGATQ